MEILGLIGLIAIAFGFPCIMVICLLITDRSERKIERRNLDYQEEIRKAPIKKIPK